MRRTRVLMSAACVAGLLFASGGTPAHAWPSSADTVTCTSAPTGYSPAISTQPAGSAATDGPLTCVAAETGVVGLTNPFIPPGPSHFWFSGSWAPVTYRTGTFNGAINVIDGAEPYVLNVVGVMVGGVGSFVITSASDGDGYALVGFGGGTGTIVEPCPLDLFCSPGLTGQITFTVDMA